MDHESIDCTPSSSSSSSSSNERSPTASVGFEHLHGAVVSPPKRKAGRKKFRETRHPIYWGVRERNGGRWVCEVRQPHKKNSRIWLGTFATPEMAARAHDVAAIAFRGEAALLNFVDSTWVLPRPRSASAEDIRAAACKAAEMYRPSSYPSSSSSSSRCTQANATESGGDKPPPPNDDGDVKEKNVDEEAAAALFVDEEALFNMHELVEDMARGMLVEPPPAMDCEAEECQIEDLSLWND